ncbi:MAG TPA: glycosyltransferase [Blastocatellia bacterium]|nr:glycosyltransferase [Blastocatellia bacterium]
MSGAITDLDLESRPAAKAMPLVSVITIFLNAEKFIEEAVESVLAQTYGRWELLLVDDGSTDNSTEIALAYARSHPHKIRYLQHQGHANRGMSASRNLGIREARGEYVAFLDADDVWESEKLSEQVEILGAHPEAAMVYGATRYWYSWTGHPQDSGRDFSQGLGVRPNTLVKPPGLVSVLLRDQVATATGCLARREILLEVGGYEESFRGLFEDQVVHSKICLKAPVFVSSRCWYKYRKHPDSCCSVAERAGQHHSQRLAFLNWLEAYSGEQGVEDSELRRVIKKERWKSRHPLISRLPDHVSYRGRIMKEGLKSIARRALPVPVYRWLRERRRGKEDPVPVGLVSFGSLRRLTPISRVFGFDRGTPVDRYYIEDFLARNASDIRGRALEVGDDSYTRRFGGDRVTQRDVLHVSEENPRATIIADLASADHIPSDSFDCIILTQTLHLIYDVRAALATLRRILKPGGVLLTTFPGITQIDHFDWGGSWYWAFTALSARRMFAEFFPEANFTVETRGNVFAAISFLHGVALEELREDELDYNDPDYQVIITVRAIKEAVS